MAAEREVVVKLNIPDMKKLTESVAAVNKEIAKLKTSITVKPKLDMTEVNKQLEGLQSTFAKSFTINLRIGNLAEIEREIDNITKNVNIKINNSSASSAPRTTTSRRSTTISKPSIIYDDPAEFSGPLLDVGGKAAKQDRFEYIMRREAFLKRYEKFANPSLLNIPIRVDRRMRGGVTHSDNNTGIPKEIVFNDYKGVNNRIFEHELTHGYRIDNAIASRIFSNIRWEKSDIPGMSTFVGDNPDYSNYPELEKLAKYIETKHYKSPVGSLKEVIAELTGLYDEDPAKSLSNFRNIQIGYLSFLSRLKQETIMDIVAEFSKLIGDDSPAKSILRKHISNADNISTYIASSKSLLSDKYSNVGSKYMGKYTDPVTLPGLYDTIFPSTSNPRTFGSNLPAVITNPFPLMGRGNQNPIGNLPPIAAGAVPPWQQPPGESKWWENDDAFKHSINRYELTFKTVMKDQDEFIKQMDLLATIVPKGMIAKHIGTAYDKNDDKTYATVKLAMDTTADQIIAFQKLLPEIVAKVGMQNGFTVNNLTGINKYRTMFDTGIPKSAFGIGNTTTDIYDNSGLQPINPDWGARSVQAKQVARDRQVALAQLIMQSSLMANAAGKDFKERTMSDRNEQIRQEHTAMKGYISALQIQQDLLKEQKAASIERSNKKIRDDAAQKKANFQNYLDFGASDRSSYEDPMDPFMKKMGVAKEPDKDPKEIAKGHLEIVDAYKKSAGTFGTISWRFTSMAMGALGVYFSISGIVMQMQRGISMITGPLGNAEATIKGLAIARSQGFKVDDMLKNMGVSMGDIVEASLKYQGIMGMINGALAALGAKLFKDKDTWNNIVRIVDGLVNIITDPGVFEGLKSLIQSFADSMPQILEVTRLIIGGFAFLAKIPLALPVTLMLLAISAAFMPIFSMISAVFSLAASWKIAGAAVQEYKVQCLLANQVMQTGSWGAQAKLGTMGAVNAGVGRNWGALSKGLKYGGLAAAGVGAAYIGKEILMPSASATTIDNGGLSLAGQESGKVEPVTSKSAATYESQATSGGIGIDPMTIASIVLTAVPFVMGGAGILGKFGGAGGGIVKGVEGVASAGEYVSGYTTEGLPIAETMGTTAKGSSMLADIGSSVALRSALKFIPLIGEISLASDLLVGNTMKDNELTSGIKDINGNILRISTESNRTLGSIKMNTSLSANSLSDLLKKQFGSGSEGATDLISKFAPYLSKDVINKTNKAGITPSVNNGVTSWDTGSVSYPTNPFTGPLNVNGTSTKVGDETYYTGYDGRTYTEDQWKALPGNSPAKQKPPTYTGTAAPKWKTTMNAAVDASNKALTNTWDRSNIPQWQIDHDNAIKAQTGQGGVTTGDTGWEGVKRVTQTVGDYQKVLADIAKQQLEEQKSNTEYTKMVAELQERAYTSTLSNSGFTKNKDGSWSSGGAIKSKGDALLSDIGKKQKSGMAALSALTGDRSYMPIDETNAYNMVQQASRYGMSEVSWDTLHVMSGADIERLYTEAYATVQRKSTIDGIGDLGASMNSKYSDATAAYQKQQAANGEVYNSSLQSLLDVGLITQDQYDRATGKKKYQGLATGGSVIKEGLFKLHAGEAVTPAKDVGKGGMTVNVTIQGNASKDVTDDMIRRIKRELMGMGA